MEASQPNVVEKEIAFTGQDEELEGEIAKIDQAPEVEDAPRPRPQASEGITPEQAQQQKAEAQEELEYLAPKAGAQMWGFGKDTDGNPIRTYTQRELSVIGKAQWFALVGEVFDKAMSGDSAMSLNTLLAPPPGVRNPSQMQLQDFQDADTFVQAIAKLLLYSPDFLEKSVCVWLSIPDYEWDLARELMKLAPDQGGLSDDMFEGILATFMDQNFVAIDRFFRERSQRIRARYQARAKEAEQSRSQRR
jgi:hypothetical protein